MAQVGTAVPSNVNLAKQKPYAVSAYSRRVKSLANNAQSFGPDSYVNITLDTSTPGSFLDPLQSYLKFDLSITNTNVFADFVSFGSAGAASVIEEFRIYVQGTPIEEILQYNVFYELAMNQNGQCQQPFHLFRPNPLNQGLANIFHQNAIKPPMVDLDGRPMFGSVVGSSSTQTSSRNVSWAYSAGDELIDLKMIQSQASVSTTIQFSGCRPYLTGTYSNTNRPTLIADAHSLLLGSAITNVGGNCSATTLLPATDTSLFPSFYRDPITGAFSNIPVTGFTAGIIGNLDADSNGQVGMNAYNGAYSNGVQTANFGNYLSTNTGILPYSGSTVEFPSIYGSSSVSMSPDIDPRNPLNWCSFLPPSEIRPDLKTLGPDNLQDYFMFLANTKYIPCGLPGLDKNLETSYDTTAFPAASFQTMNSNNFKNLKTYDGRQNETSFTYTCCIPLISGVLGSFADKCWPTMLIAPGSMYIQIRTASPQKAFQLSMDPCRRVLGTIRDYLPFGGSMGGVFGQIGKSCSETQIQGNLGAQSSFFNSFNGAVYPGGLAPVGYLPRNTFSDYTAPESFTVSATNITTVKAPSQIHSMVNGYACIGSSLASANQNITNQYLNNVGMGAGLMFRPYGVAAMEGRWTIGRAYVSQFTGTAATTFMQATEEGGVIIAGPTGFGTNIVPNTSLGSLNVTVSGTPQGQSILSVGAYANTSNTNPQLQADVCVKFDPSGIPLPQYWLSSTPWLRKNFFVSQTAAREFVFMGAIQTGLANESAACYGTFLSASVPQCRRVMTAASGIVTYSLRNIEFVSQQIILPDSVSASILEDAAQGDISITSNSLHNYATPIAASTSQNLIIPAKIASANTMYCLFVPQSFVSGVEGYCYNSLRGICPFGSVSVTTGITRNGLTGPYDVGLGYPEGVLEIVNIPCASGVFQIQLKVGNELIPQQPLTTITEVVTENVKAQHKLFDTMSNVNATFNVTTRVNALLGRSSNLGLAYDVVRSGQFCTTFVSAELCDDQTAINNPSMGYVYACEAQARFANGASNATLADYVIPRQPYAIEQFQPPESSFVIAFDMDTWSRFSDVTRSGKFLGNNTITLSLDRAQALGISNANSGANGYVLQTFVVHDIRFSFQAGGSVVSYY